MHTLKCEKPQKEKPGHLNIECRFHCLSESYSCFASTSVTISPPRCLHTLHYVSVGQGRAVAKIFSFSLHSGELRVFNSLTDKPAFSFQETREWPVGYWGICNSEQGCICWTPTHQVQFSTEGEGKAKQTRHEKRTKSRSWCVSVLCL